MAKAGVVFDFHRGMENTIVLASMGRSGSTLLANVINCENKHRLLFEPFFPDKVKEAKDFIYPLYLRPENRDLKYFLPAKKILTGKLSSTWIDRENTQVFPMGRLIKDIRVNLILRWLKTNFPSIRIILLVRHPCAVAHSWQAVQFGDGSVARERLLQQPDFVKDYGASFQDAYCDANTAFERLVFFWCIYYWVPLRQFNDKDIHLVFFENLFLDTMNELRRLFLFLDQGFSKKAFDAISRPSSTTRKDSEVVRRGDIVNGWQRHISPSQINRAYEIMSLFAMADVYCSETSKPRMEVARQLLDKH